MFSQRIRRVLATGLAVTLPVATVMADCGQILIVSRVPHIPPPVVYYPPPIWQGFPTNHIGQITNNRNRNTNTNVNINNSTNTVTNVIKVYPRPTAPIPPSTRVRPTAPPSRPPSRPTSRPTTRPPSRPTSRPGTPPSSRPSTRPTTRPTSPPSSRPKPGGRKWVTSVVSRGESFNEPNQYAVVAWNGTEEILWISTRQKAIVEGEGAALSILPLPGKPISVTRGEDDLFKKCRDAITAKRGLTSREPLIDVKIGAHNIFVLQVQDGSDVSSMAANIEAQIQDFISKRFGGEAEGLIGDSTRDIIEDYISRDFRYFSFDLIDSTTTEEIKVPIQYRFESEYCYYPMVISKIGGTGNTEVEIVAITQGSLNQRTETSLKFEDVESDESVTFSSNELLRLSPDIQKLFGANGAVAREWYVEGDMKSFAGDIAWR